MLIELASVSDANPEQLAGNDIGEALPGCSFGSDSEQAAATTVGCGAAKPMGTGMRGVRDWTTIWLAVADAAKSVSTAMIRAIGDKRCMAILPLRFGTT